LPHEWRSGGVDVSYALDALTRVARHRAALFVQRTCNDSLDWEGGIVTNPGELPGTPTFPPARRCAIQEGVGGIPSARRCAIQEGVGGIPSARRCATQGSAGRRLLSILLNLS
jgi:hypothetical protein